MYFGLKVMLMVALSLMMVWYRDRFMIANLAPPEVPTMPFPAQQNGFYRR